MGNLNEFTELLSTKLVPPQLRPPYIQREPLIARLERGLDHKLTLISAPAGFGKTTLVCEWIARRREKGSLPPLAWLSLDPEDNDPVRFWRYLLAACQAFGDQATRTSLRLLAVPDQPPFEAAITAFINEAARLDGKHVLIVDDYHLISAALVNETLSFFLDHLPETIHLILTTRVDPHLPLARLRARNELNELRLTDLRFTPQESREFFQSTLAFTLPQEQVDHLIARTEGWAAGLRLAALAVNEK
jgi:LuxR family maltose regulon positive regulatory protein